MLDILSGFEYGLQNPVIKFEVLQGKGPKLQYCVGCIIFFHWHWLWLKGWYHAEWACLSVCLVQSASVCATLSRLLVGYLTQVSDLDLAPGTDQFLAFPPVRYIRLCLWAPYTTYTGKRSPEVDFLGVKLQFSAKKDTFVIHYWGKKVTLL